MRRSDRIALTALALLGMSGTIAWILRPGLEWDVTVRAVDAALRTWHDEVIEETAAAHAIVVAHPSSRASFEEGWRGDGLRLEGVAASADGTRHVARWSVPHQPILGNWFGITCPAMLYLVATGDERRPELQLLWRQGIPSYDEDRFDRIRAILAQLGVPVVIDDEAYFTTRDELAFVRPGDRIPQWVVDAFR